MEQLVILCLLLLAISIITPILFICNDNCKKKEYNQLIN